MRFKISNFIRGFTLIELIIVLAITAILAGIISFTVKQYLDKGKDSNIDGNLTVLIPAGEAWYNGNNNSYKDFCMPTDVNVLKNAISQMPYNNNGNCFGDVASANWSTDNNPGNPAGLCCYVNSDEDAWAACVPKFSNTEKAFCVDSRGVRKEITKTRCESLSDENPLQCPSFD